MKKKKLKRKVKKLEKQIQAMDSLVTEHAWSEQKIMTAKHGEHSLRWYIRMLCENVKVDPSKELRSWE